MTWTADMIKLKLMESDEMVRRSLLKMYERQTATEQNSECTRERNGIGFSGADADILTRFAKWVLAGRPFTPKMVALTRKKLIKYSRQLSEIANNK